MFKGIDWAELVDVFNKDFDAGIDKDNDDEMMKELVSFLHKNLLSDHDMDRKVLVRVTCNQFLLALSDQYQQSDDSIVMWRGLLSMNDNHYFCCFFCSLLPMMWD